MRGSALAFVLSCLGLVVPLQAQATLVADIHQGVVSKSSMLDPGAEPFSQLHFQGSLWQAIGSEFYFVGPGGLWKCGDKPGSQRRLTDQAVSSVKRLHSNGRLLFFSRSDNATGAEPWVSDGTVAGTRLLKDICPGAGGNDPGLWANIGSRVIFCAHDNVSGDELWITDGTANGTKMVKDIRPGTSDSAIWGISSLGNQVVFRADDGTHGAELWGSDGTTQGTRLLADIEPGAASSLPGYFQSLGGRCCFRATTSSQGSELWVTNGTSAGTKIVRDFRPGTASGLGVGDAMRFSATVGGRLFFQADDGTGYSLWSTDGSSAGTRLVVDVDPSSNLVRINNLFKAHGLVYFAGRRNPENREPWVSDGTAQGTRLLGGRLPGGEVLIARLFHARGLRQACCFPRGQWQ